MTEEDAIPIPEPAFEGDFVIWDMPNQRWVEPIRKALIP